MSNSTSGKRILVDAVYVDEIRVAVIDEGKVVEFDQELKDRRQQRGGNIYYAVVRRIEPSLQAVFIEYGIGKHGFLPFSEISVENYQIPQAEKDALLKSVYGDDSAPDKSVEEEEFGTAGAPEEEYSPDSPEVAVEDAADKRGAASTGKNGKSKPLLHKMYKVQNVIKVDQKLMVQIIKEERGSKCATFSTYIVLAGRYCIFMPNSGNKNSGISRRIEDCDNRRSLREFLDTMKLPKEAGVIIRTAGNNRSQREIEQDLSYLQATWKAVCENCASVEHPSLLYVEADIIKRTLRDYCDENVHEVVVAGSKALSVVKDYAKSMFGNKLRVRMYKGSVPIFTHYRVSSQILELFTDKVHLPSGGYLVITPTEALVSIDVNSGKMTGEDSIEETAYRTNMEAVKEIARQVSLRGLSGLIVIDFIDMIKYRYCRAVEAEVREAFKGDKAKVQFGYISAFGLMEISRQRVKQSILDTSTVQCSHCKGVGRVRSLESISASILRDVSYVANKNTEKIVVVTVAPQVMSHLFNHKRRRISDIESEFKVLIRLDVDENNSITDFDIRTEKGYSSALSEDWAGSVAPVYATEAKSEQVTSSGSNECDKPDAQPAEEKPVSVTWVDRWLTRILASVS
ncbi:ribonuclease E/G [Candidatus Anaplasma sp. TIGMIC]|uniref:Rne/Rng family ribonuclease n=1 Tax=Candidatus Anaplasma sp. TIGMIC TaxID=3020713 RepID=UPI00232C445E|nr:Rne/Rng family ribonuclease [Candidatus Anaplasma sp. TIGMIC]MDB1135019.1 Rne/Rng family ribonuclease [Candidatus Anaplasma sp. TIGMIC]